MIQGFAEWAAAEHLIQTASTDVLSGRCVAVDAELFIQKLLTSDTTKEPLLAALDGVPFSYEKNLESEISLWKDSGIIPYFIFPGLTPRAIEPRRSVIKRQQVRKIDAAWDLYHNSDADRAVNSFGTIADYDVDHIYKYTQVILDRHGVDFKVAPYSAHAQMAHMEHDGVVDAIYGSSELLFYECGKVILDLDLRKKQSTWVSRQACIDNLANGDQRLWVDCCLLAGSSLLEQLPQLESDRSPKLRAAADMIRRNAVDGANSICLQYRDDPINQELDYLNNYRKVSMSIKHHVVKKYQDLNITLNLEEAPNDVHNFIGQRLPDEVYDYVATGAIGTRVLTWRTSGQIVEVPPLDGGASITYQELVRSKIVPLRISALRLLSQSLHRFYQHKDVSLDLFFRPSPDPIMLGVNDAGNVQGGVNEWHVRKEHINKNDALKTQPSLLTALGSLSSSEFAQATKRSREKGSYEPLNDTLEVRCNVIWRYLQLRGYISPSHELAAPGVALRKAYQLAESRGISSTDYEEPLLLGIELLRLGLLTRENMFPNPPYLGQPTKGSEADQRNTLLISRVACLGQLAHKPIGYTGPLSRHLLAYKSIVSALRQAQRDLLDMSLCTLFLDGAVDRQMGPQKIRECGLKLPFLKDNDCALGLAVKQYLEEQTGKKLPISAEDRTATIQKGQLTWMPHSLDFGASIEYAFNLWDALLVALKELPKGVVANATVEEWIAADAWLKERR